MSQVIKRHTARLSHLCLHFPFLPSLYPLVLTSLQTSGILLTGLYSDMEVKDTTFYSCLATFCHQY